MKQALMLSCLLTQVSNGTLLRCRVFLAKFDAIRSCLRTGVPPLRRRRCSASFSFGGNGCKDATVPPRETTAFDSWPTFRFMCVLQRWTDSRKEEWHLTSALWKKNNFLNLFIAGSWNLHNFYPFNKSFGKESIHESEFHPPPVCSNRDGILWYPARARDFTNTAEAP